MTRTERRWAFWAPKLGTGLTFVLILFDADLVGRSVTMVYLLGAAVTMAAGATLVMLARGYRQMATLTGLVLQAALLILDFAALHYSFGLRAGITAPVADVSFATALYFSVVTWTTLGYGDYVAAQPLQLIAALEAAIGYVYLGLIVGLAATLFSRPVNE